MTIASATVATSGSAGNGATTSFTFSFRIATYGSTNAEDQIQVLLETISSGAITVLTKTTHYTVSVNADQDASPGGSITTVSTYSSSYRIWIRLNPSFLQETDLQAQGAYSASVIEGQLDELQRQINVLKDRLRRAPVLNTPVGASFDGEIDGPYTAGYGLIVAGDGLGFTLGASITGTISATMASFCASGSLSAARSTLGLGTAAEKNTGTSGDAIGLLNIANFWSALQTLSLAGVPLRLVNTTDAAANQGIKIESDRATPANNDYIYASFILSDSAGNQDEMGRIRCLATDVTSGSNDARFDFAVAIADTLTTVLLLTGTNLSSNTNDQLALGSASIGFADLHGATGFTINMANGNWLMTHSSGVMTVTTGDLVLTSAGAPSSIYSVGYRGSPVVSGNSAYAFPAADAGSTIYHDEAGTRTYTIPANASVAHPIGTIFKISNTGNSGSAGTITLAITSDTLRRGDGTSGTGSRTISANQCAVIEKVTATIWEITGGFT